MTTTTIAPAEPIIYSEVFGIVEKADDLEVHVRIAQSDGETFVDIRDMVKSTGKYGRGIHVPADVAWDLSVYIQLAVASITPETESPNA